MIETTQPFAVAWLKIAAYGLSVREEQLVALIARGESNRQIAATLDISEHTFQRYLGNTFDKVGVRSALVNFSVSARRSCCVFGGC